MPVSSAQAIIGLNAAGTPSRTNVTGTVQIGPSQSQIAFPDADAAYSVRMIITEESTANLNLLTNSTTGSDAWTAGVAQVETATAAGTITASGDLAVVVSGSTIPSTPITLAVPVTSGDTAAVWAGKVRSAMNANANIADYLPITGETTAIIGTRTPLQTVNGVNIYAGNDATINISLDNGTCTGVTTAATSANTTVGVATSGAFILDGDEDVWGDPIPEASAFSAVLFEVLEGAVNIDNESMDHDSFESYQIAAGKKYMMIAAGASSGSNAISGSENLSIESIDGTSDIKITVILSNL
jgi:hypothetical protein